MIRAAIHGRLGGEPVQRTTRNGGAMTTASAAVDVAKPGEEAISEWISILAFGAAAESLARCAKGDVISAMGPLARSIFTDRSGQERSSWSLVAETILSARTVRNTSTAARPRRARSSAASFYTAPQQPGRASTAELPADRVDDLYP
jgi:single-strand DNA-binding protein